MRRIAAVVGVGMLAGCPWFLLGAERFEFQVAGLVCGMLGGLVGGLGYDWYTKGRGEDRGARYF